MMQPFAWRDHWTRCKFYGERSKAQQGQWESATFDFFNPDGLLDETVNASDDSTFDQIRYLLKLHGFQRTDWHSFRGVHTETWIRQSPN